MIQQQRCSCYRKILIPLLSANANLRQIENHSFATFDAELFSDQPDPSRYQSDLSPRQQILGLKQASRRFIAAFDQPETRNLLFVGKPGTGKTFLMACIARELLYQFRSVHYMPAPAVIAAIQEHRTMLATFNPDNVRFEKAVALYDSLMNCDLLLIDDLVPRPVRPGVTPICRSVIDARALPDRKPSYPATSPIRPLCAMRFTDERLLSRLTGGSPRDALWR